MPLRIDVSTPFCSSRTTTSLRPLVAAKCSAVFPNASTQLTFKWLLDFSLKRSRAFKTRIKCDRDHRNLQFTLNKLNNKTTLTQILKKYRDVLEYFFKIHLLWFQLTRSVKVLMSPSRAALRNLSSFRRVSVNSAAKQKTSQKIYKQRYSYGAG